jgi:hypothetical protein
LDKNKSKNIWPMKIGNGRKGKEKEEERRRRRRR